METTKIPIQDIDFTTKPVKWMGFVDLSVLAGSQKLVIVFEDEDVFLMPVDPDLNVEVVSEETFLKTVRATLQSLRIEKTTSAGIYNSKLDILVGLREVLIS